MVVKLDLKELPDSKQYDERMIAVSDNEKIKVIVYPPEDSSNGHKGKMPIVFIGGWLARTESYLEIINHLRAEGHEIISIETREKNSSTATEYSNLSGERLFRDVQEILHILELDENFVMFGHSLGAICSLLQAVDESNPKFIPSRIIALQPVIQSVIQKEQLAVFKLPTFFFKIARYFMVKMAPLFSKKLRESEYSRKRFHKEFFETNPGKLRRSAIGFENFCLHDHFREISTPVLFLGISEDEHHPIEDPKQLAQMLPKTEFHDLVSEEVAFSSKTAEIALKFLERYAKNDFLSGS
ncbi:MAG: hypothetical protein GF308_11480 [Candidatus Heimdallarchaeota archaeon]|nr:hypothetical protein [Candidatus Heimdallarchaeota archaeon]